MNAMLSNDRESRGATRSGVTRRVFLKLSLALSGLLAFGGLLRYLGYQTPAAAPHCFTLKPPGAYPPDSVTRIPQANAWIVHDAGGLYALSGVCPHLGCAVRADDSRFECPCHGSRFTRTGEAINGPSAAPLRHMELTLSTTGELVLDTHAIVSPHQRISVGAKTQSVG